MNEEHFTYSQTIIKVPAELTTSTDFFSTSKFNRFQETN